MTVLPYQDLVGWGNDTRMNRPRVAEGCRNVRITPESEAQIDRGFRGVSIAISTETGKATKKIRNNTVGESKKLRRE